MVYVDELSEQHCGACYLTHQLELFHDLITIPFWMEIIGDVAEELFTVWDILEVVDCRVYFFIYQ